MTIPLIASGISRSAKEVFEQSAERRCVLRYSAANPFGRVPLFVTRQRVGRKRAPLRRPSGSLAASLSHGLGPRAHPCSPALDFPSRKIHPARPHPLGAAKGGLGRRTKTRAKKRSFLQSLSSLRLH